MGNIVSVFRYEPFSIFSLFSYQITKGYSVGKFGILKLAGAPFSKNKGGGSGPLLYTLPSFWGKKEIFKKRVPAKSSKGVPAKSYSKKIPTVIPKWNTDTEGSFGWYLPIPDRGGGELVYNTIKYVKSAVTVLNVSMLGKLQIHR